MAGAAFFDLDKTLIEGSSALHFARAAYRAGMVSRRQLARDGWANLKFRLNGSTDAGTDELRQRILDAIAGQRQVDLARMGADVLAGILPLLYREVDELRWLSPAEALELLSYETERALLARTPL